MVVSTIFLGGQIHETPPTTIGKIFPIDFPGRETPTWGGSFTPPGVPTNSPQVLKIHCRTGEVDLIGPVFQGDWNLWFRDGYEKGDRHKTVCLKIVR